MSVVNIGKEAVAEFMAGNGTVGESEVHITTVDFPVLKHVVIVADPDNAGTISVGPFGRAGTGFVLKAGVATPPIYIDQTWKVGVVASEADQNYSWIAN